MPTLHSYDHAVVRVVPRVERGEFVNAGVIVSCAALGLLQARIALDDARLLAIDPHADLGAIHAALATLPRICEGGAAAGAIGLLTLRERFHWLVAPRSSSIQTSAVHTGRCAGLPSAFDALVERLMRRMVLAPAGLPLEAASAAPTAGPAPPATTRR